MIQEGLGCASIVGGNKDFPLSSGLARLKEEHGPLRQQMEAFLAQAEKTSSPEDLALLRQQVAAFQRELDPHSEREEQVLFPMMASHIGRETGPIAVMEYEHEQAKGRITRFLQETQKLEKATEEQVRQLTEEVNEAYHILSDHFLKEENVLFPMAENVLSEEEKEELARRIQEI